MEVTTLISILWVRKFRSREVKYLVQSSPVCKCPRSGSLKIDAEVETCTEGLPGSILGNNTVSEGSGIELKEEVTHACAALTSACPLGISGLGGPIRSTLRWDLGLLWERGRNVGDDTSWKRHQHLETRVPGADGDSGCAASTQLTWDCDLTWKEGLCRCN